jgi:chromosome segregation ATPase
VNDADETYYQETIALLQEEVARLEAEALARDDRDAAASPADVPAAVGREAEEASRRVDALAAELAARDETIALLLEQVRLAEQAEEAGRAEWEQLHRWVEEVERRVEGFDGHDDDLRRDLEAERRRGDDLSRAADAERRSWDARREALEGEAARLRAALAEVARKPDSADLAMLEALEGENRRLRDERDEMMKDAAAVAAAEVESLREQLRQARDELDRGTRELRQAQDDLHRERNEHEAEVAALKAQMARETLRRQEGQLKAAASSPSADGAPSVDERIRALRLHLQEIHDREQHERASRTLSARLSRLWRNTSPQR